MTKPPKTPTSKNSGKATDRVRRENGCSPSVHGTHLILSAHQLVLGILGAWVGRESRIQPLVQEPESLWRQQGLTTVGFIFQPIPCWLIPVEQIFSSPTWKTDGNGSRTKICHRRIPRDQPLPPRDWPGHVKRRGKRCCIHSCSCDNFNAICPSALAAKDLGICLRSLRID